MTLYNFEQSFVNKSQLLLHVEVTGIELDEHVLEVSFLRAFSWLSLFCRE